MSAPITPRDIVLRLRSAGIALNVTRFADGSVRLNRWRAIEYWSDTEKADELWKATIGDDSERIEAIRSYLLSECGTNI